VLTFTVLFDMDGTLVTSVYPFEDAMAETLSFLKSEGVEVPIENTGSIAFVLEHLRKECAERYTKLRSVIHSILEKYDEQANASSEIRDGALEALSVLKSFGCKLGVVSNSCRRVVLKTLSKHSLLGFFDVVVTREECERLKPFPDPVLSACQRLNVKPSRAIFVGDSWVDVVAGNSARVKTVYLEVRPLKSGKPWAKISSLSELPLVLNLVS